MYAFSQCHLYAEIIDKNRTCKFSPANVFLIFIFSDEQCDVCSEFTPTINEPCLTQNQTHHGFSTLVNYVYLMRVTEEEI